MPLVLFTIFSLSEILLFLLLGSKIGLLLTLTLLVSLKLIGVIIIFTRRPYVQKYYKKLVGREGIKVSEGFLQYGTFLTGILFLAFPGILASIIGILLVLPKINKIFYPIFRFSYLGRTTQFIDNKLDPSSFMRHYPVNNDFD